MTDEMYVDFPIIEHDFMAHCGTKLKEFDDVCWYDQTYIGISRPVDVMYSNVLRLIYNGAKLGDSYCLELIKSLYKTYYKKELVNTAPVSSGNASNEDYLKEIAELRNKLNKAEQDIQYLRSNNKKAKTEAATFESLRNQFEAEHEELIPLRNYVYNLTDETGPESNTNVEELKKAIEDKNILIIGGHPNWHNKLKTLFPNWSFIGVEKFASLNPATADGRDKVYFFSNFIGHSEYYRFTSYMQKHDVNYGYLKDTNTDSNIKQIFEELK